MSSVRKHAKLGWQKDKFDKRDFTHMMAAVVPDVFILPNVPPVRDQGNVGSCVGFGIGAKLTSLAQKLGVYTEWFSPTWIYNGARYIAGDLKYDDGAYPKDALDWLRTKGCLLEHFWPYNPNALDPTSPPSKYNTEAAKFPLLTYYRIDTGTDGICSAISQGYPVSIGTPWFDKWMDIGSTGVLPAVTKSDYVAGGHETCLYGYDKVKKVFYGINSWGDTWGKKGTYIMPFSAFAIFNYQGGYDAHYVDVKWGGATPTPTLVSITISPANASIIAGTTTKFTATGLYSDGTTTTIVPVWSSSKPTVVTVDTTGLLTGVTAGTAIISATMGGITGTATITITAVGPLPPGPIVIHRIRIQDSTDGGKTWVSVYEGDLK
jgi:hypothetical protein